MSGADRRFERSAEDVGNIIEFGHVNLRVPDQRLATLFYATGLGLTRDPFLRVGVENMWMNVGTSQFHLPTGPAQVLRGTVGLVMPDLDALVKRLESVQARLDGTSFAFRRHEGVIEATCPWGNRFRCHAPNPARFGRIVRGIPYLEIEAVPGSIAAIVRFYEEMLGVDATAERDGAGAFARVPAGLSGELLFRDTGLSRPFDGHHVQITLADFSGPHCRLLARGLVSEESSQHQYRFERVIDLENGSELAVIEHEVRSLRHPMFGRVHLNRDPEHTANSYTNGPEPAPWITLES